jgi:alanine-glyoxylate transaminase/serine-glyoxylate transaminase/serine-pyruvate transaminase
MARSYSGPLNTIDLVLTLAHLKGKAFRLWHFGNVSADILRRALLEVFNVLEQQGKNVDQDAALSCFEDGLGTE